MHVSMKDREGLCVFSQHLKSLSLIILNPYYESSQQIKNLHVN